MYQFNYKFNFNVVQCRRCWNIFGQWQNNCKESSYMAHSAVKVVDWIIQSLKLPVVTDMSRTETESSCFGYLSIAANLEALRLHVWNFSTITTLFQIYLLTLSQISFKNYHFNTFFCAQTDEVESVWKLCPQFERKKKSERVTLYLIWLKVRR